MWQSHAKLSFLNDDEDRAQPRREGRQNSLKSRGGRGRPTWLSMSRKRHGSWVECSFMLLILTVTSVRVLVKTRQWKWRRFASTYSTYEYARNGVCVCICLCMRSYADKMNGVDRQKHKTDWVDMTKIVGNQLKGCHTYTPKHTYTRNTCVSVWQVIHIYEIYVNISWVPQLVPDENCCPSTISIYAFISKKCNKLQPMCEAQTEIVWRGHATQTDTDRDRAAISHFSHISRIVAPAWK